MVTSKDGVIYCSQDDWDNGKLAVDTNFKLTVAIDNKGTLSSITLKNGYPLMIIDSKSFKLFDANSRTFK